MNGEIMEDEEQGPGHYSMNRIPRGRCIIINNRDFKDKEQTRHGTDKDADALDDVFKDRGFLVTRYDNNTGSEMRAVLQSESEADHTGYDCFICCVLSHGDRLDVCGVDDATISRDDIIEYFYGSRCNTMINKPKVFIFQTCQGNKEMGSMVVEADIGVNVEAEDQMTIAEGTDILIANATVPGFVAYRHMVNGSYFIQTLCETMKRRSESMHIIDILKLVHGKLKRKPIHTEHGPRFMITNLEDRMEHHLYLHRITQYAVAAFDIGTTYSGYAFKLRTSRKKVFMNKPWIESDIKSLKTPSVVLLNEKEEFHSFGYEAMSNYKELFEQDKHSELRIFRQFILQKSKRESLTSLVVKDTTGEEDDACRIYAMVIKHLQQHLKKRLIEEDYQDDNLYYIISTPPSEVSPGFEGMIRKAAVEAGIIESRLTICMTCDAAYVRCKRISPAYFPKDSHNMIVDLGARSVIYKGRLNGMWEPVSGPEFGKAVDDHFLSDLKQMYGANRVGKLQKPTNSKMYMELMHTFEDEKKRFACDKGIKFLTFQVPSILTNKSHNMLKRYADISQTGILKVDRRLVAQWFDNPVKLLLRRIRNVLSDALKNRETIGVIVFVGGMAENEYVQQRIGELLKHKKHIPNDACIKILEGAVTKGLTWYESVTEGPRRVDFIYR